MSYPVKQLKAELDEFGTVLTRATRKELRRKKMNASGRLSKSIQFETEQRRGGKRIEWSFLFEDYGDFQDKGVKGIGGKKADGSTWRRRRAPGTPYKFRKNTNPIPRGGIDRWSVQKGIAPRSTAGTFLSRKGLIAAIAVSIKHRGLAARYWWSKPFEKLWKELPDDLTQAYANDIEDFLDKTIPNV